MECDKQWSVVAKCLTLRAVTTLAVEICLVERHWTHNFKMAEAHNLKNSPEIILTEDLFSLC